MLPSQLPGSTPPIKEREPAGPLVSIIIIVAMLALGAFYFWGKHLNEQSPVPYIPADTSAH